MKFGKWCSRRTWAYLWSRENSLAEEKVPLAQLKMQASHGRESAILQQIMFYIRMRECKAQMESSSMEIIIHPHAMNTKAASCCNLGVILALPLMASSNFKPGTVQRFLEVPKKI